VGYRVEGDLLEVCDCGVLCPCWVGEDADNGTCEAIVAYHVSKGEIEGTDVSGLSLALMVHIPGNILKGNWRAAVFMDERASKAQEEALLKVWTGQLGGPVADFAKLIGEVVAVKRASISFDIKEGAGTLKVDGYADAALAPFKGPGELVTTLQNSVFSTIPGSPAYLSKASHYRRTTSSLGLRDVNLQNHNAVQGKFLFTV
jgi:hypothetical protein